MSAGGPAGLAGYWRSLGRHSAGYLLGEGFGKGVVYLLLIAVAPLVGVRDFGHFNLYLSLLTLATALVGLGLPDAVLRLYHDDRDLRRTLGTVVALVAAASVLLAAAAWGLRGAAVEWLALPLGVWLGAAASAPPSALRQVWLAALRTRQRSAAYAAVRVAEPLAFALGVALCWWFGRLDHGGLIVAYLAAAGLVAGAGLALALARPGLRPAPARVRPYLAFSLPLVPHALAMGGLASFDQIVIQQQLGGEANGLYAFAYRFGMAMFLCAFALGAAWSPLVLERLAAGDESELAPLARRSVDLATAVAVLLCALLVPFASWFGGDAYRGGLVVLPWVVYGYLWMVLYTLAVVFLIDQRRSGAVAAASSAAFLFNAVANYLLVPRFGIVAAAATTVASYALLFALVVALLGARRRVLPFAALALRPLVALPLFVALAWWLA